MSAEPEAVGRDEVTAQAWAGDDHYRVLGVHMRVQSNSRLLAGEMQRLLMPFAITAPPAPTILPPDAGRSGYRFLVDDHLVLRGTSRSGRPGRLLTEVNRHALAGTSLFAVHAGAVARADRVIAFPGASGAGKTTLTAACLLTGFSYVSDEALCISYDNSLVEPYPKPLMLSPESCRLLELTSTGTGQAGEEVALLAGELASQSVGPGVLSDIVLLERSDGRAELVDLPAADGMAALLRFSFNHYRRPPDAFRLAGELARNCRTHLLRFGDPLRAAALLRDSEVGALPPV